MRDSIRRNEARKILRRWAKIDDEISAAEMAYKALCDEIDMVAAIPSPTQKLTGMPHTAGGASQQTESVALRRVSLAEAYQDRLQAYNGKVIEGMRFKMRVQDAMILCEPEAVKVVERHWKGKAYMFDVAKALSISESTAWRYERIVLDAIADEFGF